MTRIIPSLAAGLLMIGACAWVCGLPETDAGQPPVRSAVYYPTTGRTELITHAVFQSPNDPKMELIPTQWDTTPELLPPPDDIPTILVNHKRGGNILASRFWSEPNASDIRHFVDQQLRFGKCIGEPGGVSPRIPGVKNPVAYATRFTRSQ